jgi:hypothetical protein
MLGNLVSAMIVPLNAYRRTSGCGLFIRNKEFQSNDERGWCPHLFNRLQPVHARLYRRLAGETIYADRAS